jgi:hypothetical protein
MTDVDELLCRFCFEGPDESNPLIDPCKCIGSMRYVHVKCIRRWRAITTNYEWISRCQLCLTDYEVYLRWPKEDMPHEVPFFELLTERHFLVATLLYYIHITCISLYPTLAPYFSKHTNPMESDVIQNPLQPEMSAYSSLGYLYFTRFSYCLYVSLLGFVTFCYMKTYYNAFWKHIRNRRLYTMLWFSCITDHGILQTPFMTIFIAVGSGVLSLMYIIPFGYLYIYMLSYFAKIHMTIIRKINISAEIF